ncbi:MAG: hypothetical protein M1830_005583 [Pleopsidium flavum]|nr:MAG: hypothetical protein M1830_005583 [Pleopsidium flavum]
MCSDCSDFDPECGFCGLNCHGDCDDPDKCLSCWYDEVYGDYDPDLCGEIDCSCGCHEGDIESWRLEEFNEMKPKLQPGVFPFLKLPGELRNKVYHHNMKQYDRRRRSFYFKGKIDTALLSTCRQVNKEARHIPLSINKLSFASPFHAYRFLGFGVASSQKQLVRSVHIDVHGMEDFHGLFVGYLLPELAKMSLKHLGVTLKGRIEADWFTKIKCLEKCLTQVNGLTTFDLVIGSGVISKVAKDKIVDALRKKIVKDPGAANNPLKRKATTDDPVESTETPARASKKLARASSLAAKREKNLEKKSKTKKAPVQEDNSWPHEKLIKDLLHKYAQLKEYARTYDERATSVKIRLERAYEAATEGKEEEFEKLVEGILITLEAHFAKIVTSRKLLPYPLSSSGTVDSITIL